MVIVDSSIWIGHLKQSNKHLSQLLQEDLVMIHPLIIGELACGSMKKRGEFLSLLKLLPVCQIPTYDECLSFLEEEALFGKGIGWVDINILAASRLSSGTVWTFDKRLHLAAERLKIAHKI